MKKLVKKIKYRLFAWLMDDICKHSTCRNCEAYMVEQGRGLTCSCAQSYVLMRAGKVWCEGE